MTGQSFCSSYSVSCVLGRLPGLNPHMHWPLVLSRARLGCAGLVAGFGSKPAGGSMRQEQTSARIVQKELKS